MDMNLLGTSAPPPADDDVVRVFQSADAPADPAGIASLNAGALGADLAAPAVVLPDFHHKSNMEMPSSIAVATRGTIRSLAEQLLVELRHGSDRAGCGAAAEPAIEDFYRLVKREVSVSEEAPST